MRPPALSDGELDEARAALAIYRAAPRGSTPRAVDRVLAKLVVAFPAARLSDAEAEARAEIYAEQLADLPADMLMAGAMAAVRTLRFFPTIAELRDLARRQPATPRRRRETQLAMLVDANAAMRALPAPAPPADLDEMRMLVERCAAAATRQGDKDPRPVAAAPVPARKVGVAPREPNAADYAALMGISEAEAVRLMVRDAEELAA